MSKAEGADSAYAALADPTRRAILDLLRDEPGVNAGEIAAHFPHISRPAVSKHLRVLRDARLVSAEEQGREWKYQLDPQPLADIYFGWLQTFAPMWEESLRRLKHNVEERPGGRHPPERRQRRA